MFFVLFHFMRFFYSMQKYSQHVPLFLVLLFIKVSPLNSKVSDNVFDKMPVILPMIINAPPEIPVVILNGSNEMYICNISKSRIDFIVNLVNSNNADIFDQLESFDGYGEL